MLAAAEVPGAGRIFGLVGAQCGPVCIDEAAVGFCGALRPTTQVAELTAVAAAMSLLLAHEDFDLAATSIVVRPDSLYTVRTVTCAARAYGNVVLVHRLRVAWLGLGGAIGFGCVGRDGAARRVPGRAPL